MEVRIAICDDQSEIRGEIERLVRLQVPQCHMTHFCDGESLLESPEQFDIVFLDIQMKEP
jgi:DNA-binding LytR/AlgR family response regulator